MTIYEAWDKVREILKEDLADVSFASWIEPLVSEYVTEDTFVLYTDNTIIKQMVEQRYKEAIVDALRKVTGVMYEIEIVNCIRPGNKIIGEIRIEDGVLLNVANWMEKVIIPAEVHEVRASLGFCEKLRYIDVDKNSEQFTSVDGVLFTKDMKTLVQYPCKREEKEYHIPDGVVYIGSGAFQNCDKLKAISMTDSVEVIGDSAFAGCDSLEKIRLSKGIRCISDFMMDCCLELKEIIIPKSVEIIKRYAFRDCGNLTQVRIPERVKLIEEYAFSSCERLKSVHIKSSPLIEKNAFRGSRRVTLYADSEGVLNFAEKSGIAFKNMREKGGE